MYNEDPELFLKELDEIGKLRSNSCIRPKEDVTGITDLKRYYSQLHLLQNRFKLEGGDKGPFNFSWSDPYAGSMYTLPDFDYELASVLYNLGSLHSILGASEKRDSSESMKVACTHFQCAAWAFHTLPDRYPKVYTPDISPDLMAVMSQICLAQAQECILEKSILDHRKSSIISKVGTQVSEYYFAALHKLETSNARHLTSDILLLGGAPPGEETVMESIGHKNNADWIRRIEFKFVYHKSVAHLYAGLNSEEAQKMGERITHYQASLDKLMECAKLASSSSKDGGIWKEALTFSNDVIKGKLDNAKKENEFIYHEKVPEIDTLVELKGASLVKGIGFEVTDREIAGADIFSRLVPLEAHEASSLYSEEKAKVLRVIGEEIESKNNELALFMSSMSLDEDGVVPKPDEHIALPQELIEVAASLSVKGEDNVTVHLKTAMSRIAAVSAEVETSLKEIRDILKDNEEQEKEFSEVMNSDDKESSKVGRNNITQEIATECEKFEGAHKMASDSNSTLHNAIKLHMDNLKLLTLPLEKLQKEIPSMADLDEESEANVAEVRRILLKVEEMKEQRLNLESSYRRQLMEDDITKKLVLHKDKQLPEIFEIEIKKHDKLSKLLRTNLSAQSNIIKALTEVNAKYVETRRIISDLTNSRNEMIGSLVASFYAHEDLLHKAAKGLEFYDKLDSNVTKLLHRVEGVVKVHQEERDAIIAKYSILKPNPGRVPSTDSVHNFYPHAPPMYTDHSPSIEKDINFDSYIPMTKPEAMKESGIDAPSPVIGNKTSEMAHKEPLSIPTGKPTLKDYLKIMKENKNDASAAYAAINFPGKNPDDKPGTDDPMQKIQNDLPAIRPAPVGSESIEPSVSGMFQQNIVSHQATFHSAGNDGTGNSRNQQSYPSSHNSQSTAYFSHTTCDNTNTSMSAGYPQHTQPVSQFFSGANAMRQDNPRYPVVSVPRSNVMNESLRFQMPRVASEAMRFPIPLQHQIPNSTYEHVTPNPGNYCSPNAQFNPSGSIEIGDNQRMINSNFNANQTKSNEDFSKVSKPPESFNTIHGASSSTNNMQVIQNPSILAGNTYFNPPYPTMVSPGNAKPITGDTSFNSGNINLSNQPTSNIQATTNQYGYPTNSVSDNSNFNNQTPLNTTIVHSAVSSISPIQATTSNQAHTLGNVNQPYAIQPGNNTSAFIKQNLSTEAYKPAQVQQSIYTNPSQAQQTFGQNNYYPPTQATQTVPYGSNNTIVSQNHVISHTNSSEYKIPTMQQGNQQNQFYHPERSNAYPSNSDTIPQQTYQSRASPQINQNIPPQQSYQNPLPQQSYGNPVSQQSYQNMIPHSNVVSQQYGQNPVQTLYQNTFGINQVNFPTSSGATLTQPNSNAGVGMGPNAVGVEIKMKPIVPQPGTKPLTPNVNPNSSYSVNSLQQIQNTVKPEPIKQQSQVITNAQFSEAVNINPVSVKRSSSFDDMLNSDQDDVDAASSVITLQPKVLTANELAEQKRQAKALKDIVKASNRDPYEDEKNQKMLLDDINMMENKISSHLEGKEQMWLDEKWKLFNSFVTAGSAGNSEVALGGGTLSVARCYPMKNRAPDILPFDSSRVELPATKDDYINASHIRHLSPHAPNFIATQWPPANTHNDFWTMVWQEQIETIVCLLKDPPVQKDIYWPSERKEVLKVVSQSSGTKPAVLSLDITLQSVKIEGKNDGKIAKLCRTERTFTILNKETNTSRVVIQIQIEIDANTSGKQLIECLSDLSTLCLAYYRQQRVLTHPILAHCLDGSGRTASFILMVAAASEIDVAIGTNQNEENKRSFTSISQDYFNIFPDIVKMAALMAQQRKGILRERHHFKNAYEGMILHSRNILIRKGVLNASEPKTSDKSIRYQDLGGIETEFQQTKNIIGADEVNTEIRIETPCNLEDDTSKGDSKLDANEARPNKQTSNKNFFSPEFLSSNLSDLNLSDPLGLSNDRDSPQRKRITKQDFLNASTSSLSKIGKEAADDKDPLSQLDPLWSMK